MKKYYINVLLAVLSICLISLFNPITAQIAAWDFTGEDRVATSVAEIFNSNLVSSNVLTRGGGASESVGANSFRTLGFQNDGISTSNLDYFQVQLKSRTGFKLSLSSIDARFEGTTAYYASPGVTSQFAYSLDGTNFTLIGLPVASSSLTLQTIDLSSIVALQNVSSAVTITLRYYASGQTTTGGWGFFSPSIGSYGLNIGGSMISSDAGYYYKSASTGNWNTAGNWQSSPDGINNWNTAVGVPTSSAAAINIRSPHIITLDGKTTATNLTIETGGTLNHPAAYNLSIIDGSAVQDMNILGTYEIYSNNITLSYSSLYVQPNGIVRVNANTGSDAFTNIPNVYFLTNSVFEWNTTMSPQIDKTYFPSTSTQIPIFRFTAALSNLGNSNPSVINGILDARADIGFAGSGNKTFRDGITGNATVTFTSGGTIQIDGSSPILGGTNLILASDRNIIIPNGITIPAGAVVKVKENLNAPGPSFAKGSNKNFFVEGIIDMTNSTVSNTSGAVIINGTLKTAHPGGLEITSGSGGGTVSTLNSVTQVNAGSTIEYNAAANQIITSSSTLEGTSPYYNIVFSGGGTKTPGSAVDISSSGSVSIKDSTIVDFSANNLGSVTTNSTSFSMDRGRLKLGTNETLPRMRGTYNLTGGVIEFKGSSRIRGANYQNIEVTGAGVGSASGNIVLNVNGTFKIINGGIFEMTDNSITGPMGNQAFEMENNSVFKCSVEGGFYGRQNGTLLSPSVRNDIENIMLTPGSTISYARTLSGGNQTITNTPVDYQNLEIAGIGIKTAPADLITVQQNLTKSGTSFFVHNGGKVLLNGTGIPYTFAGLDYYNLEIKGGQKSTAGSSSIADNLAITNNATLNISANDIITILSTETKTASISTVSGSINYGTNGAFKIDRYLKAQKAWRFLATPVSNTAQTIKQAWQDNQAPGISGTPGIGTQITGPQGTTNGFDEYTQRGSMKFYNPAADVFTEITTTSYPIANRAGYMLFVRGDRTYKVATPGAKETIISTKGQINLGTQAYIVAPGKFLSVGNPFASRIDPLELKFATGIKKAITVWNPTQGGNYGVGAYNTYTQPTSGGAFVNAGNIALDQIESGQAFFIEGDTGGNLDIPESAKIMGSADVSRTSKNNFTATDAALRFNFYTFDNTGFEYRSDGSIVNLDNIFDESYDALDIRKFNTSTESISILSNGELLATERRPFPKNNDTLYLRIAGMRSQSYRLQVNAENMAIPGLIAFLYDRYLNTATQLNLVEQTDINVTFNSDALSYAPDRFYVVYKVSAASPFSFLSITAAFQGKNIIVNWKVKDEENVDHYEIERSANGRNFNFVARQAVKNNTSIGSKKYFWLDASAFTGNNFYRIKTVHTNGSSTYSNEVKLSALNGTGISVFPNPMPVDGQVSIDFTEVPADKYSLQLINAAGQIILQQEIKHIGGSATYPVSLPGKLTVGKYVLKIKGENNFSKTLNLIN